MVMTNSTHLATDNLRPVGSTSMRTFFFLLLGGLMLTGLAGCSSSSGDSSAFATLIKGTAADTKREAPADELYREADKLLAAGYYEKAAKGFEEVDRQHPYSPYARRAIVMAAYAHYKNKAYDEAITAARRYVTLHPGTKEAALAQHIIASALFDQINDSLRDQSKTREALKELKILLRRYPNSRYAEKARNRIRLARDVLAAAEMNVGRYYLKNHNYLAAINRFKVVVRDYQTTAHVEEALMRLTEAYMALGIKSEAQTAAAILGHNFPDSKWYKDAYVLLKSDGLAPREDTGSWLSRTWRKVKNIKLF